MARGGEPKALYNLANDIQEKNNVMDRHPQIVVELKKALHELLNAPRNTNWK